MLESGADWAKVLAGPIGAAIAAWFTRGFFRQTNADKVEKRKADAEVSILESYKVALAEERVRCTDLDKQMRQQSRDAAEQLHAMSTLRYEAEAEAAVYRKKLDAAELATEAANRRAAAAGEAAKILKAGCTALEMMNRRLALQLRQAGVEPADGDG